MIIGIDPGHKGGIAALRLSAAGQPIYVGACRLPHRRVCTTLEIPDAAAICGCIETWANAAGETWGDVVAVIEQVHSMPGNGGKSMFSFGAGFGALLGIMAAMGVPVQTVAPSTWKADMKLGAAKSCALGMAQQLFPRAPITCKADDGVAEALLIALWSVRTPTL